MFIQRCDSSCPCSGGLNPQLSAKHLMQVTIACFHFPVSSSTLQHSADGDSDTERGSGPSVSPRARTQPQAVWLQLHVQYLTALPGNPEASLCEPNKSCLLSTDLIIRLAMRERNTSPIYWFTPQTPAIARVGPGQSQEPQFHPGLCVGGRDLECFSRHLLPSRASSTVGREAEMSRTQVL